MIFVVALVVLVSCFLIWQLSKHRAKHTKHDIKRICKAFGMFRVVGGNDGQ